MHHNWAKAWEPSWFELWVELLFNDPEVTKIQTDPSSNLRAIRCYEKAGFERQGTVTTPDGPARTWFKHARHSANTQCCLTLPSRGTSKGWRPWPPLYQTLNIMREAVIAEVSTQLSEVVGVIERHLEPTLLAVHLYGSAVDGGLKPHSDIDLLVTVTVRLDETTRRALINDLLETSASPGERDSPRCRSHHCCARRHHSVALSS